MLTLLAWERYREEEYLVKEAWERDEGTNNQTAEGRVCRDPVCACPHQRERGRKRDCPPPEDCSAVHLFTPTYVVDDLRPTHLSSSPLPSSLSCLPTPLPGLGESDGSRARPVRDKNIIFYIRRQIPAHLWAREPVKDKDKAAAKGPGVCSEAHCCVYPGWKGGLLTLQSWKWNEVQQWETLHPQIEIFGSRVPKAGHSSFPWQKVLEDWSLYKRKGYSRQGARVECIFKFQVVNLIQWDVINILQKMKNKIDNRPVHITWRGRILFHETLFNVVHVCWVLMYFLL